MRCLLWLTGVLLAVFAPVNAWNALLWLLVAAIPILCGKPRWRSGLLLVAGFLQASHAVQSIKAPVVDGMDRHLVEARILSIPARDQGGWQFDAELRFLRAPSEAALRARLAMPGAAGAPEVGERWQFAVQFNPQVSRAAARALLRDHLSASGRVVAGPLNHRIATAQSGIDALRSRIAARIHERVADPSAAALLAALAVGATGDVSPLQWRVFNATGITHLVAISGMHVTFFAMLSMLLARRLWSLVPGLRERIRREAFAASIGVAMALAYALLSGFSVPAQRTVVMLAAFLLLQQCARTSRPAWSMAAAAFAVMLYDPLAVLSAGFWLSFGAVAAIVLVAGARMQQSTALRSALQVQGLVTVALLPATLAIFGSFSAIGLLANALAIPVFTFLLVPPLLLATLGYLLPGALAGWCAEQLVGLTAQVAEWLWPVLVRCAGFSGSVWSAAAPLTWYPLAAAGIVLAVLPLTRLLRVAALGVLCSVFLLRAPRPAEGELWIDMLDVGASTAVMLRTSEHLLLYGSGEKFGSGGRSFESRVLPALRASGYAALDLWLLPAVGRDVGAAVVRAAALFPLRRVETPGALPPPELGQCETRSWQWDAVQFSTELPAGAKGCVLKAVVKGQVVEFRGDSGHSISGHSRSRQSPDGPRGPEVLLVPRVASAAARLQPATGTLLLASVSASEWQSATWRKLRLQWAGSGLVVLATPAAGEVALRVTASGVIARRGIAVW